MNVLTVRYGASDAPASFTRSLYETGFAVLAEHPIPTELIRETYAEWERFFASDAKHAYKFDPKKQSGYFPFRSENAKDSPVKDLKEFYHLYPWGQLPEGMSKRTWDLYDRITSLAIELLSWIQEATPQEIRSKFSMPLTQMTEGSEENLLRILHYPPLEGTEEEGAIRAAAHEDINLITLLPAATAPGLQVKDTADRWHDVPCDPGSLVINAGDMLQMATRGHFRSTTHRVMNPTGPAARSSRFSMPLFLHPRPDVRLSENHTARSYLHERLREIGLLKEGESKSTA